MRGRKPKATSLKIAEGDASKIGARKLREKAASEPKASSGLPPCPQRLKGIARDAWEFWAEELAVMNLDKRADAMMLEGACANFARAVKAEAEVIRLGEVFHEPIVSEAIDPKTGKPFVVGVKQRKNIWVSVCERSWLLVNRFCSEFGLSPVSRTRLSVGKQDEAAEDLMAMLTGPYEPKPVQTLQ